MLNSQLTVLEKIYYQTDGEQPSDTSCSFSRRISTEEQAYQRVMVVGTEWKDLDTGWIENPSMIYIRNLPHVWQFNPTPTERKEQSLKVLLVTFLQLQGMNDPPCFRIPPGESLRLCTPDKLIFRSEYGQLKAAINAFPGEQK